MLNAIVVARIAQNCSPVVGQMVALIETAQGQQTGIARNLPTGKIGANGMMAVEGEGQLW